jgi:ribosomal 50S subunit-associated protein YjgA (DUF615 family)
VRKLAHRPHRTSDLTALETAPDDALATGDALPSKTRRKAEMHALQDLGEAMVRLSPDRLAALALPERLFDAIRDARNITRWEARRRQMQFIGRLMRDVDPLPIQARLEEWAGAPNGRKSAAGQRRALAGAAV